MSEEREVYNVNVHWLSNRQWRHEMYDEIEFIANILIDHGYAKKKGKAGYIVLTRGGVDVMVSPFFMDMLDVEKSYEARLQCDAIEDWLHEKHSGLVHDAKHGYPSHMFCSGNEKRKTRIKMMLVKLIERNVTG